jgi:hypothetical protein
MGMEQRHFGWPQRIGGEMMIRIRDISMEPRHNVDQLLFEAAKLLQKRIEFPPVS